MDVCIIKVLLCELFIDYSYSVECCDKVDTNNMY